MKTLFLIRGLPGSGKSTLAEALPAVVLEADQYFYDESGVYKFNREKLKDAHVWCLSETKRVMQSEHPFDIAVANTFTQEWELKPYIELAEQYGYRVTTLICENRHESESIHDVPPQTIERMRSRFNVKL